MRIRQIKPAFWSDSLLAEMPEGVRLFYIGLWMLADDAGWLRWEPVEVARDLYGYESRSRRERRVSQMFDVLVEAGRVIRHACGHAEIPKMPDHQRLAGPDKQVRTAFNEHSRRCLAPPRVSPPLPDSPRHGKGREGTGSGNGKVREGQVSEGTQAQQRNDEPTEFDRQMAANGIKPSLVKSA